MKSNLRERIREVVALEVRIAEATSEDEQEDLFVERAQLRSRSIVASIYYAVGDIHARFPLLLPLVGAAAAIKYLF